jgi:hypothetical protein
MFPIPDAFTEKGPFVALLFTVTVPDEFTPAVGA